MIQDGRSQIWKGQFRSVAPAEHPDQPWDWELGGLQHERLRTLRIANSGCIARCGGLQGKHDREPKLAVNAISKRETSKESTRKYDQRSRDDRAQDPSTSLARVSKTLRCNFNVRNFALTKNL